MISDEPVDIPVASARPYVDEVIVVRTGGAWAPPADCVTLDRLPTTHPELFAFDAESGLHYPTNFAALRQASFDAATADYALWLDSDDTLEGADQLPMVVEQMRRAGVQAMSLDYDCERDALGRCTSMQRRERILQRGVGRWAGAVHEYVTLPADTPHGYCAAVKVIHHKYDWPRPPRVPDLAVKIMERIVEPDARTLFHLGKALSITDPPRAREYFQQYLRVATWRRERALVQHRLGTMAELAGDPDEAQRRYEDAVYEDPFNPDGWFGAARLACGRGEWARCCAYTEQGFQVHDVPTPCGVDPLARKFMPHVFYSVALGKLGRVMEALASCDAGLALYADDPILRANRALLAEAV
jgi:tetratricopeptide (TPR) repeat protein